MQKLTRQATENNPARPLWTPQAGPQTAAYNSPADIVGFGGSAGGGKALALDTPLPTPTGWTTMGAVRVGDYLLDDAGRPCQVTTVSEVMTGHEVYEVEFDDGSAITADADHRWLTMAYSERMMAHRLTEEYRANRRAKRPSRSTGKRPDLIVSNRVREYTLSEPPTGAVRTTREIAGTLTVNDGRRINHAIGVCAPLQLPPVDLSVPPYVFGAWLGDGTSANGGFTSDDPEIIDRIRANGYEVNKRTDKYGYGIIGLKPALARMGVIRNKHIPTEYLRASEAQRLDLLRGLMDTDGTCLPSGSCEFYSVKWELVRDVWELLQTLGIKCSIRSGRATIRGKDCGPKYRIKFTTARPVFYLTRKATKQVDKERGTQSRRYIVDARPVASVPVKCVAVDSPSHLYLAGHTFIPTHNTDLLLGIAGTQHTRAVIFRREFPRLEGIEARSREIFNSGDEARVKDRYNESLHRWELASGATLRLAAMQYETDKNNYQGRPYDFYGFDEVTEFSETQVRFVTAWNRTTKPGQRCRVVMTFNPPMNESGEWVIRYFAPWLDPLHSRPAADGELRWYGMVDGEEVELESGEPFEHAGETVRPRSRTFFHSYLRDNPILEATGYGATIDALPEPLRSLLRGNFGATRVADPFQVIPADWVRAAVERGRLMTRPAIPQTALGVDVAYGGRDKFVIAPRWGYYVGPLIKYKGKDTPDGGTGAGYVMAAREDESVINIDYIGWGTAAYESLRELASPVVPVNFAERTQMLDRRGRLKFASVRAAAYWRLRDLLDPEAGFSVCLPDDPELVAELVAPRWEIRAGRLHLEKKDDIKDRLGRSPDSADAVVLAFWGSDPLPAGTLSAAQPLAASRFVADALSGGRWGRSDSEHGWRHR